MGVSPLRIILALATVLLSLVVWATTSPTFYHPYLEADNVGVALASAAHIASWIFTTLAVLLVLTSLSMSLLYMFVLIVRRVRHRNPAAKPLEDGSSDIELSARGANHPITIFGCVKFFSALLVGCNTAFGGAVINRPAGTPPIDGAMQILGFIVKHILHGVIALLVANAAMLAVFFISIQIRRYTRSETGRDVESAVVSTSTATLETTEKLCNCVLTPEPGPKAGYIQVGELVGVDIKQSALS